MTFKLLKRRYRSMEEDEHLRTLEYFNQPFEPGNGIRILDDLELEESLSLESLGTNFGPADPRQISAIDRETTQEELEAEVGTVDEALKEARTDLDTSYRIPPPAPQEEVETPHEKNKKKSKGKVDELGDLDMFGYDLVDPSEF